MKNTPEQFKGDEIPKQPTIYGADIQRSLQREASLEKPYLYGGQAMVQAIAECNLSAEMAQKLAKEPYERDALHLIRMLRRSEAERDFSLAYLRHRDDFFAKDKKRAKKVTNVICSEGPDTTMFWTFAPYLFKALTEMNVSEGGAISLILSWSQDGVSATTEGKKRHDRRSNDYGRTLNLRGLNKYITETYGAWVLTNNPSHISHRYTEQEAKFLAKLLIDRYPVF